MGNSSSSRVDGGQVAAMVSPVVAANRNNTPQLMTFEMLDDDRDDRIAIETDQLAQDFGSLYLSKRMSDVTFVVGTNSNKERIFAHRQLLAARSKVFDAMLYSRWVESSSSDIIIEDISPSAFKALLSVIYKDQVTLSPDIILEVLYAAKKYQVNSLTAMALRFMQKGLTPDNACSLLEMAPHLLEDEKFAIDFIEKNAIEVLESPGFLTLTPHALSRVIRSDALGMSEVDLFEKILVWANKECERRKLDSTKANLKKVLEHILPNIRFPTMTMEELTSVVAPTELLSKEQLLSIYVWMGAKPDNRPPMIYSCIQRAQGRGLWRLDPSRISSSITLSQNNTHIKCMAQGHAYFIGSKDFSRGRHCWRVHLDRLVGANWVFIGIVAASRKNSLKPLSFGDNSVYGFSSKNQIYHGGPTRRQDYWRRKYTGVDWNRAGAVVDVLLDCDEGTLTYQHINTKREWRIEKLPRRAYVPHFNVYDLGCEVRVETIRLEDFGQMSSILPSTGPVNGRRR